MSPLCTPWDLESLAKLEEYGMEAYKVASADLTNHELLGAFSDRVTFLPHGSGHDIPLHIPSTIATFLSGAMNVIGRKAPL